MPPTDLPFNQPRHVSVLALLEEWATRSPQAPAILAPARAPLTYGELYRQVTHVAQALRARGIARRDRVALVLPNGPEMAVAFLAVAAAATCVPLNPTYSSDELASYLADLNVSALLIEPDVPSPARALARARGLTVVDLLPVLEGAAGMFTLLDGGAPAVADPEVIRPNDVALLLHTAGTTSRPKGVPLTHHNLCVSAHNMALALALDRGDRCLNVLPLFHMHGLMGPVLVSMTAGASVVCPPDFSVPQFFAWLDEFSPTWYTAVPTIHQALLAHAAANPGNLPRRPLRFIRSGSAPLSPEVLLEIERVFRAPVVEIYGMTETTGHVTCQPMPGLPRKLGSVGVAAGPHVAIMDETGTILPTGASGEIAVRGVTVMEGYDRDPIGTATAFSGAWFRTGDQGYLDSDGYLFVTGRLKEMINRGGEKIAPQEVDAALLSHPAVAQAVTFAVPDTRLGEDIAAAVVLRPGLIASARDLRQFVAQRLAVFKVPRQIFVVEALPQGTIGKLQRIGMAEHLGLTSAHAGPPSTRPTGTEPRTPLEEMLAGFFAHVLGTPRVGVHDDFFALGGDSLLATQLLSRLREATHVALSFESVFATPTVAGLARRIAASGEAAPVWETLPVRPVPREGSLPLSYPQHRLWFLEQLALNPPAYNIMDAVHLSGRLNAAALAQSLQDITSRHEVLRTTFVNVEGEPRQVVGPCTPVPVSVVDLQDVAAPAQAARVEALAIQEAHGRFDHARAPLIRVTLVRLAPEEQVLLLAMPQLVCDGWSHGVFWRDLAALYEARCAEQTARLADLPVQYADFAYWQRDWMHGHALDAQLAYWTRQLAGAARLQLRSDYPRPTTRTSRGAKSRLSLPLHLAERLRAISQKHDVTLFMTLLAAFQAVLHRYTGQDDILIGSLVAGRNRPEFEGMLGFFTNTVALRTDLSGDPRFDELLNRVRAVMLGAFSHQDVPFEKLLEAQALPRDPGGSPLLQVLFVLQNVPSHAPHLPGLASRVLPIDVGTARFEMALELAETPDGIHGWLEYNTDLFAASTVDRLGEHLRTVLRSIAGNPAQRLSTLPLWTAEEHRRLLESWSTGRSAHRADVCLHQMFEAQTARTPQATAVICEEARITYGELNGRANQLAHYLRERGAGPGTLVGLCMERSIDMVVALLGILKAGAGYVPLDPTYPKERLAFMLADAEVVAIVTKQALAASLPCRGAPFVWLDADERTIAQHSEKNAKSGVTADDIAYLLYTSGSTGAPKGVLGVHRATLNALTWMWETYPFAADEVCCQKTSLNFGDSILELFGPLLSGTSTVLIPDTVLKDLRRFVGTLAERRVTRIVLVPSLLRALLDTQPDLARQLPHLALWFCSGEILLTDVWRRFCARMPHRRLVNFYGASEMSDDVTWYEPDGTPLAGISVPIGRPIPNVQVYVLDPHLQPVPIAVQGELHVAGACLTRGYLKRPDLTAERFIPNPFSDEPGARLYKTGDRARFLADGNLEFLGRVDEQVKLRGYRIEPREIELALEQHSSIRQAVVIAREEVTGDLRLVAYLVINGEVAPPLGALRRFLRERLPDHMVPSALVTLDRLPLTPSGKIDRRALPTPDRHRPALDEGFVAPRTATEALLARIWAQLLVVEQVGVHDSFFELGGHSLLAMQLLSRIHAATRVDVPLLKFFETPTVAHMAEWIDTARPTGRGRAPIPPVPRGRRLSASVAQEHLWLLEQAEPHPPSPNISHVWRLTGPLVVAVLDRSVDALIRRHESLRTTFRLVDGRLELAIASAMRVPVVLVDLRGLSSPDAREAEGRRLAQAEARQPFDFSREPLIRLRLWRVDEEEHLFLVTLHHIVSDGWSLGIFIRELAAVYAAYADDRPVLLAPLSIQYAEFAHWQRQWVHDASLRDQLAYWKLQLRGPLRTRELPTDRPRRYGLIARTTRESFALPRALFEELAALSQRADGTLFMTVLAGFEILLHGYTGEEDMRVATFVANRHRHETEGVIGLFADMVILRTDLGGNPGGREVLRRVRAATLEAYTHADFPFEELVRILERERGLVRASLSRVMVIWQNAALFQSQLAAPPVTFVDIDQRGLSPEATLTTFDIILELREHPDGLTGSCLYDAHLFDAGTVRRLLDDFRGVLELMVARPDQPLANFRQSRRPGPDGAAQ